MNANDYTACIDSVYSAVASAKSAKPVEARAEFQRAMRARDRLIFAELSRKNQALSDRAARAMSYANDFISQGV